MLTSHRFTVTVTGDTHDRLERVASNERPMGPGEAHRGAVRAMQAALADLNHGYLLGAEVDGYYGQRTSVAVEAFQRDYGLFADGIVGKQTIFQMDAIYSPSVIRPPIGVSVHVGVDRLDAGHYGADFALSSCANDATAMAQIADALGYQSTTFVNEDATVGNFISFIRYASSSLFAGDTLFFTFSGHGSQIPDTGADFEADGLDETLCFHDRMLVDDELYTLLASLQPGVRVIGVFDSCHSGSAAKRLGVPPLEEERKQQRAEHVSRGEQAADDYEKSLAVAVVGGEQFSTISLTPDELKARLDKDLPPPADAVPAGAAITVTTGEGLDLLADLYVTGTIGKPKLIDFFSGIYEKNQGVYDSVRDASGPKELAEIRAAVVTLSACDDAQTTPAGSIYSLFTYNIVSAWNRGGFSGNYRQFHRALLDRSRADSTPVVSTYGRSAESMTSVRPFLR